jgi:hypothetical protein
MTVAQAHEINMWIAFIVVALPCLIVFGGRFLTSMAIALAALALFFSHPILAIAIAVLWLFPWRIFWAAFAVGEGLKFSGIFGRLHRRSRRYRRSLYPRRRRWNVASLDAHDENFRRGPPRTRGRRPEDGVPWDDPIDFG